MAAHRSGIQLELRYSSLLHRQGIPLLLCPRLLRSLGAGQVDMARLKDRKIELIELKQRPRISLRQRNRLKNAAILLSSLFELPVQIKLVSPKECSNHCQKEEDYLSYYL